MGKISPVASQTYNYSLVDLAPDSDKFMWQVSGPHASADPIRLGSSGGSGSFRAYFRLPTDVRPGTCPFTLAASATETCGSDPSKDAERIDVDASKVEVRRDPKIPP